MLRASLRDLRCLSSKHGGGFEASEKALLRILCPVAPTSQRGQTGARIVALSTASCALPSRHEGEAAQSASMASIYENLRADIVVSMKARDSATTTALRTADAAIKRAAMDGNKEIDDTLTLATLRKAVKNLTDANAEFAKGGRNDLITANETEIKVLQKYLPAGLDAAKLDMLISAAIVSTGATSKREMGKVIGALKAHPDAALIDFGAVSKLVQAKLP